MLWLCTDRGAFNLRDGRGHGAEMKTVGAVPVAFENLSELEARTLAPDAIVLTSEAAVAERTAKAGAQAVDATERKRQMLIKVAAESGALIATRRQLDGKAVAAYVVEAFEADPEISKKDAIELALEQHVADLKRARAEKQERKPGHRGPVAKRKPKKEVDADEFGDDVEISAS